jgi:hypothetical protein
VEFPVILDGYSGHGGIMSVRRLVKDNPYVTRSLPKAGAAVLKQRELEQSYFAQSV